MSTKGTIMSKALQIKDYNNYYITDTGKVYSRQTGRIKKLSEEKTHEGYLRVQLCNGKTKKHKAIHRLVAIAFIPNPDNLPEINHIDGDKANNCVTNLEWCSSSDNKKHAFRVLNKKHNRPSFNKFGKDNPKSKIVQQIKEKQIIAEFYGIGDAERKTGINNSHISSCCNNKRKSAGGYQWRYK